MNQQEYNLGTFEVTTGELVVSDPCYDLGTWCMGALKNVKKGKWHAVSMIEDNEERNAALFIYHDSISMSKAVDYFNRKYKVNEAPFEVGVDSGQAGFFDASAYKNDATVPAGAVTDPCWTKDGWYGLCATLTLGDDGAGVLPGGAVSSSGYGDGGYFCHYAIDGNHDIVYADIIFIGEDDDEEDY